MGMKDQILDALELIGTTLRLRPGHDLDVGEMSVNKTDANAVITAHSAEESAILNLIAPGGNATIGMFMDPAGIGAGIDFYNGYDPATYVGGIYYDTLGGGKITFWGADGNTLLFFIDHLAGRVVLNSPTVPASASAAGVAGSIAWDTSFWYVCTATNTWKRVAIATW